MNELHCDECGGDNAYTFIDQYGDEIKCCPDCGAEEHF